MTPQERDLLTNLVTRLRQAPAQQRDSEADTLIGDLVRDKPDTPYVLAQTVLIQDYALHQAQARITELEQQLQGGQPQESGGFLSAIFGSGKQPAPRPQPQPQQSYQPQPAYASPPQQGPWGSAPAQQVFAQSAQPSFLRSAATTAAGIAGGALLFQGIESLFGGHGYGGGFGGAGFGGLGPQPGITETVVNNYYDDSPSQGGGDTANFDHGASDQNFTDTSFDDGGGFDGGGGNDSI